MARLEVFAVEGIGEVGRGDDLAGAVCHAVAAMGERLLDGDVVVVTQKVVSKAEGAMARVDPDDPLSHKPLVESESVRVLRRRGDLVISETRHGFVCANAGIDLSNVARGWAALLPEDPDRSARRIRDAIAARTAGAAGDSRGGEGGSGTGGSGAGVGGVQVGVVISDTFGRPWRRGVTDVAIGCAGLRAVLDLRGTRDAYGRELQVTEVAVVDEIAAAAELVMGKATGAPAAVVRGVDPAAFLGPGERGGVVADLVRDPSEDLFR
jgi:coenzyme F420-0:L-glutamate ligase/coenzyme F420-1:gamma-L-glutamate ligase